MSICFKLQNGCHTLLQLLSHGGSIATPDHTSCLEVKIKQYILDAEPGTFTLQPKGYRANPNKCKTNCCVLHYDKWCGPYALHPGNIICKQSSCNEMTRGSDN